MHGALVVSYLWIASSTRFSSQKGANTPEKQMLV
jgi:hypothetical protein